MEKINFMDKINFLCTFTDTKAQEFYTKEGSDLLCILRRSNPEFPETICGDMLVFHSVLSNNTESPEDKHFLRHSGHSYMKGTLLAKQLRLYKESIRNIFLYAAKHEESQSHILNILNKWCIDIFSGEDSQRIKEMKTYMVKKIKYMEPLKAEAFEERKARKARNLMKKFFRRQFPYDTVDKYKVTGAVELKKIKDELKDFVETMKGVCRKRKRMGDEEIDHLKRMNPEYSRIKEEEERIKEELKVIQEVKENLYNPLHRMEFPFTHAAYMQSSP